MRGKGDEEKGVQDLILGAGYPQEAQRFFWTWKERRPQRRQSPWDLMCRLPKLSVPLVWSQEKQERGEYGHYGEGERRDDGCPGGTIRNDGGRGRTMTDSVHQRKKEDRRRCKARENTTSPRSLAEFDHAKFRPVPRVSAIFSLR